MKEIIKLWKDLGITEASATYNCGGDAFGDADWSLKGKDGEEIENDELVNLLYDEMFVKLTFFEVSDGYYIGEWGSINVALETDDEEGEILSWSKEANYDYSEAKNSIFEIEGWRYPSIKDLFLTKINNISEYDFYTKGDSSLNDDENETINKFRNYVEEKSNDIDFEEGYDGNEFYYDVTYSEEEDVISVEFRYYVIETHAE